MAAAALTFENLQPLVAALAVIVVLSMLLERALAVVFEWGMWDRFLARKRLRAPLALLASYAVCAALHFDILRTIPVQTIPPYSVFSIGSFLTAATVAGGSKGAITLFQNVLGFAKGGSAGAAAAVAAAPAPAPAAGPGPAPGPASATP
jgi:uncharacterized BrkB/YihY/UPF0761 family membrane protein